MGTLREALDYARDNPEKIRTAIEVHLRISLTALALALAIFVPLGVLVSRLGPLGSAVAAGVNALRVIPSLAVLFLLYPILGLGDRPAIIALAILAGPPLVINTDAGLRGVNPATLENARGLGMTPLQVFGRVQVPLALPVIVAGVRTAAVEVVASATLAAFIGAGGLGVFITAGLSLLDYKLLLVGAIPVTLLAFLVEAILAAVERLVTPPVA